MAISTALLLEVCPPSPTEAIKNEMILIGRQILVVQQDSGQGAQLAGAAKINRSLSLYFWKREPYLPLSLPLA